jgi:hypothetical protein
MLGLKTHIKDFTKYLVISFTEIRDCIALYKKQETFQKLLKALIKLLIPLILLLLHARAFVQIICQNNCLLRL